MSKAADLAYEQILQMILRGDLKAGDQVKEEEMAERAGLSRTPVREALRRLEGEMFIHRTESQRSFVSDWTDEAIEEIFALRAMLEAHAARRAAVRADAQIIADLRRNNELIAAVINEAKPDIETFIKVNAAYHRLILEAAASERLAQMLNRVFLQPIVQQTAFEYDRAHLGRSLFEHEEVVAAIERHDPDWAGATMTAHVRRAYHVFADSRRDD